jgi:hypothetical protein
MITTGPRGAAGLPALAAARPGIRVIAAGGISGTLPAGPPGERP